MLLLLVSLIPVALIGLLSGDDDPAPAVDRGDDDGDVRLGGEGDNTINGDGGDDLIVGFKGDDLLQGNAGVDLLVGDIGADTLNGGAGNDVLLGGSEDDLMRGDDGGDLLVGGSGDDSMAGGAGEDLLIGMDGANTLDGGAGNDVLIGLTPDRANPQEILDGVDSREFVQAVESRYGAIPTGLETRILQNLFSVGGEPSADRLIGGDGDDELIGDRSDVMTGGAGADSFVALVPPQPADPADPTAGQVVRVEDFDPAVDQLELLTESQGDVTLTVQERDGGVMVAADGANVIFLPGLRAAQVSVADIVLSRV
ncbi:calcium-binding protein [Tabrizicola sp. M-4]|uniref:calcium-binding protein n=1 Tax=Tabrizicola sp. M-4 TaxID=3055847 RepID=UPI003DA84347